MKFRIVLLVAGFILWIMFLSILLIPSPFPKEEERLLYVDGNNLRNASGKDVYLKGVQVHKGQRERDNFWTMDDVKRIKEAGGNCVELHTEMLADWMPQRNQINETYFIQWLDREVAWCEQYGIYYIINLRSFQSKQDWQRSERFLPRWLWEGIYPYSYPLSEAEATQIVLDFFDTDSPKQEENRQAWINAWEFVADRYKNKEYALFGLMNEPFVSVTISDEENAKHLGETYSILMERTIDAIRSVGAEQVIFIDYPRVWSFDYIVKIERENIVWEAHYYITGWSQDLEPFRSKVDKAVQKFVYEFNQSLYIGEYGTYSPVKPDNWQYIFEQELLYLDSNPICGRSWHEWGVLDEEYMDSIYDWFNEEETEWIIKTVLGAPSRVTKEYKHTEFSYLPSSYGSKEHEFLIGLIVETEENDIWLVGEDYEITIVITLQFINHSVLGDYQFARFFFPTICVEGEENWQRRLFNVGFTLKNETQFIRVGENDSLKIRCNINYEERIAIYPAIRYNFYNSSYNPKYRDWTGWTALHQSPLYIKVKSNGRTDASELDLFMLPIYVTILIVVGGVCYLVGRRRVHGPKEKKRKKS